MARARWWPGVVLALVLARLAMSWILLNDIPRLQEHDGWYFPHGGDNDLYFKMAQSLAAGQPIALPLGIGQPLVMAGLLKLTGASSFRDILPWLVIINGFVLGGLSVWVMAQLAYRLTHDRRLALAAAGLWAFSAYALWLVLGLHGEARQLRAVYVPRQLWMNGLTDPPALFMSLLGLLLVVQAKEMRPDGRRQTALFLIGGLTLGLAAVFRFQSTAILGMVFLALLWVRQWRGLLLCGLGLLIGFTPQFWYNAIANGHVLNMPYISGWLGFDKNGQAYFNYTLMHFSPQFLGDSLNMLTRGNWLVATGEAAVAVAAIYLFIRCWRQCGSFAALIMFGAPLASFGLHISTFVFTIDPIRFTLPALSIGIPAATWAASFVAAELRTKLHFPSSTRPLISRARK